MKCEIICKRGNSVLVRKEDMFYFIDLMTDTYKKNKDPNVFFKFGYFEDVTEEEIKMFLPSIEELLADENRRI